MHCLHGFLVVIAGAVSVFSQNVVHDVDSYGAVRGDASAATVTANTAALIAAIAAAKPGDTVLVQAGNKPYYLTGGVVCTNAMNITIRLAGDIIVSDDFTSWPYNGDGFANFFEMHGSSQVLITGEGSVDGSGQKWWDAFIDGEEPVKSRGRVHLFVFTNSTDLVVEKLKVRNSPNFHFLFEACARVTARYLHIDVDRFAQRSLKSKVLAKRLSPLSYVAAREGLAGPLADYIVNREVGSGKSWKDWFLDEAVKMLPHWALQPEDLNTDGIDPSGTDFHIHDCEIHNDDDSIAVKPSNGATFDRYGISDCSRNMLIENMVLSGFGASIGSVPPHPDVGCVRNITFRNISMPGTGKGVYIKSNPTCQMKQNRLGQMVQTTALIEGITYEDIVMTKPFWWPIWIGPQQQHEPGSDLGDKCSLDYPEGACPTQGCATFSNIILRNVRIEEPLLSAGVILGNVSNPMTNIVFDHVVVKHGSNPFFGKMPFGPGYKCEHAAVTSRGGTSPAPKCSQESDLARSMLFA